MRNILCESPGFAQEAVRGRENGNRVLANAATRAARSCERSYGKTAFLRTRLRGNRVLANAATRAARSCERGYPDRCCFLLRADNERSRYIRSRIVDEVRMDCLRGSGPAAGISTGAHSDLRKTGDSNAIGVGLGERAAGDLHLHSSTGAEEQERFTHSGLCVRLMIASRKPGRGQKRTDPDTELAAPETSEVCGLRLPEVARSAGRNALPVW